VIVRRFQRVSHLLRDGYASATGIPPRDALGEVLALNEFHHERAGAVGFFEADMGDVRVLRACAR
jgi:hypothetical protein